MMPCTHVLSTALSRPSQPNHQMTSSWCFPSPTTESGTPELPTQSTPYLTPAPLPLRGATRHLTKANQPTSFIPMYLYLYRVHGRSKRTRQNQKDNLSLVWYQEKEKKTLNPRETKSLHRQGKTPLLLSTNDRSFPPASPFLSRRIAHPVLCSRLLRNLSCPPHPQSNPYVVASDPGPHR